MKRQPGGIATGIVVALLGIWLVLRTVTHDDEGKNLPDRILGLGGSDASAAADSSSAAAPAGDPSSNLLTPQQLGDTSSHPLIHGHDPRHPQRKHARAA